MFVFQAREVHPHLPGVADSDFAGSHSLLWIAKNSEKVLKAVIAQLDQMRKQAILQVHIFNIASDAATGVLPVAVAVAGADADACLQQVLERLAVLHERGGECIARLHQNNLLGECVCAIVSVSKRACVLLARHIAVRAQRMGFAAETARLDSRPLTALLECDRTSLLTLCECAFTFVGTVVDAFDADSDTMWPAVGEKIHTAFGQFIAPAFEAHFNQLSTAIRAFVIGHPLNVHFERDMRDQGTGCEVTLHQNMMQLSLHLERMLKDTSCTCSDKTCALLATQTAVIAHITNHNNQCESRRVRNMRITDNRLQPYEADIPMSGWARAEEFKKADKVAEYAPSLTICRPIDDLSAVGSVGEGSKTERGDAYKVRLSVLTVHRLDATHWEANAPDPNGPIVLTRRVQPLRTECVPTRFQLEFERPGASTPSAQLSADAHEK